MIYGIGLPRTGNHSLHNALKILGYKSSFGDIKLDVSIMKGELCLPKQCDAVVDFLGYVYAEIHAIQPDAKFIITTRDCDSWCKSIEQYMNSRPLTKHKKHTRLAIFGSYIYQESLYKRRRKMFHDAVYSYSGFTDTNFLSMDVREGWKPLCLFLNKDIPNITFPHSGKAK